MANQYKNLAEFNAYKDRISEYIAQEISKFPNSEDIFWKFWASETPPNEFRMKFRGQY